MYIQGYIKSFALLDFTTVPVMCMCFHNNKNAAENIASLLLIVTYTVRKKRVNRGNEVLNVFLLITLLNLNVSTFMVARHIVKVEMSPDDLLHISHHFFLFCMTSRYTPPPLCYSSYHIFFDPPYVLF